MKIKSTYMIAIICIAGLLIGIGAAAGIALLKNSYEGSESGTISPNLALTFKVDGVSWTNLTALPSWGNGLIAGQTVTKTISITNTGNVPVTSITLTTDPSTPLPSGWTETISALPATLAPGATATGGTISLTPSSTATFGSYNWDTIIAASQ